MDSQITLRLPRELDRALNKRAKARGVPKSQLVREAVARYIAEPEAMSEEEFQRIAESFVGCLELDHEAMMADPIARQIYEHNTRT